MTVPVTAQGMQTHKKLLPKMKNQEVQFAWSVARWGLVSMTNSANSLLVPARDGHAGGDTHRISAFGALEVSETEERKSDVYHQTDCDVTPEDVHC